MCLRVWGLIMRGGSRACEAGERDGIAVEALSSTEGPLRPKVREARGVCGRGYPPPAGGGCGGSPPENFIKSEVKW